MKKQREPASPPAPETTPAFPRFRLHLAITLAVAAVLRIWYIDWGLPDLYEEATPVVQAWKMWIFGQPGIDLNPHFFNYPALTFYLNFAVQAIQYAVGHLAGTYATLEDFGGSVESHILPARILAVAFDLGTVYLVYLLGSRLSNRRIGLLAAILVALNPLHIAQAHYVTVDIPLTFFTVLSLLWITQASETGSLKYHLLAGVAIGLAAASKYTGAFILVAYAAGIASSGATWRQGVRELLGKRFLVGVLTSVVVFAACNPYILLSFDEFYRDFSFEQYHVATGHLGLDTGQATIDFYLFETLAPAISWLMLIIFMASTVRMLLRREKRYAALTLFPIVYIGIISSWEMRADRYLLPVIPLALLLGLIGALAFWNDLRGMPFFQNLLGKGKNAARWVGVAAALAVLGPTLYRTVAYERSVAMPDTRGVAKEWILKNMKRGSMIASGSFGIAFPERRYNILYIPFLILEAERVAPFYDARWYTDFDLVIASSFDYDRYAREPAKYADFLPYYDTLRTRWKLAGEVTPQASQPGPTFWFYEPTEAVKSRTFGPTLFEKLHGAVESARISSFLNNLSFVVQQKGQYEKAEEVLGEILSVEVQNIRARNSLALVLSRQGKYEQALLEAQKSLKVDVNQPEMFDFAGKIFLNIGKLHEAELSFYKAISLDNAFIPAHKDLIDLYRQTNDKKNLLTALMRYRALLPPGDDAAQQLDKEIAGLRGAR